MTIRKWELLHQYLIARSSTGISVKAWCENNNLNYNTARRYIKPNANISPLTIQNVNSPQNANTFWKGNCFIGTYEEALQFKSTLKQSWYEVHVKLILTRMQFSILVLEINRVADAINREPTLENSFPLHNKYANHQTKFNNKIALIESLSNLSCSYVNRILNIKEWIALSKVHCDKLKLLH